MSVGFSGDIFIAAARAEEVGNGIEIAYSLPTEGAQLWFDMMAIPSDAPNPDAAHAWINFIMDPQVTADITNYVSYANANACLDAAGGRDGDGRSGDLPAAGRHGEALPHRRPTSRGSTG